VTEALGELGDEVSRAGSYQALARRLIQESRGAEGLVLFVDDVQWADPATLEFLAYTARRVSGERVLMVMAYRRESIRTAHLGTGGRAARGCAALRRAGIDPEPPEQHG
jgi:predicted ATPase